MEKEIDCNSAFIPAGAAFNGSGTPSNASNTLVVNANNFSDQPNGMVTTTEDASFKLISLSPNPASEEIRIRLESNSDQELLLEIVNINGQLLKSKKRDLEIGVNHVVFSISDLMPGMYFVNVLGVEQRLQVKFVKQ